MKVKHPSQEDLLGYVLGALDAQEQREVQQLIDADPELEERLLEIRSSLAPLDCLDGSAGPRPGLARRTSEMVASFQKQLDLDAAAAQTAFPITDEVFAEASEASKGSAIMPRSAAPFSEPAASERVLTASSWSLSDMLVVAAAVAVIAAILLPAVSYSRFNSRLVACQNNLRGLGTALISFSNMNESGDFPQIPECGELSFSGAYAVMLKDCGLIEDEDVLCPSVQMSNVVFEIPSSKQLENSPICRQSQLRQRVGDYGYTLGYVEGDKYQGPRNKGRAHFVLLSDMPSQSLEGRRSGNHGGYGQNCLFEDGHYEFVQGHAYGEDPIFVNDQGIVAPGVHASDSVIAPSHLSPKISYASR